MDGFRPTIGNRYPPFQTAQRNAAEMASMDRLDRKYGHSKVIWREGIEEIEASESYDSAAEIMQMRVDEIHTRKRRSTTSGEAAKGEP